MLRCKQIIGLGLKPHQSARLQRNTHITSWTLNWGKHSPNNRRVYGYDIWWPWRRSRSYVVEVESGGITWPKDLRLGPGPCCFLFLTEPWRDQDMSCPLQGLWKIITVPSEVCCLCHLTYLFSCGNNQIGFSLDSLSACCFSFNRFATGTCCAQDHLAGLLLQEGLPKGCHQGYNHIKVLIFLWDTISIFFFTLNPLWYSWPWRTCSRQDWGALVLRVWLTSFEGLPWGGKTVLLPVVQLIDQGFTPEKVGGRRKTLKCEIGRKGQMNFPFHWTQHEVGLTADGSKSFCTPELVFQSLNYGHRAIRQHLDLLVFFKNEIKFYHSASIFEWRKKYQWLYAVDVF